MKWPHLYSLSPAFNKLPQAQPDVPGDMPEQDRGQVASLMYRNCCCAAVRMPEAFMGTALPNFLEPERGKDGDGLARLKSGDA